MKLDERIENLIAPIIKAMGYELWGIELHQSGKHTLLRVYIEVPINIDDCSKISNQVGALLDVENLIAGSYNLEVSSPGIERSLFKIEHYRRYIGSLVCIKLRQPKNGRRSFTGKIHAVFNSILELAIDNEIVAFELASIGKVNLNT